jgi:hypothetical protein
MEDRIPRFLRKKQYTNGRVREEHAPPSILFRECIPCSEEAGETVSREFQLTRVHGDSGISVFRCVICNCTIDVKSSASAEKNKKQKE